jgi:hypothetical protein
MHLLEHLGRCVLAVDRSNRFGISFIGVQTDAASSTQTYSRSTAGPIVASSRNGLFCLPC